MDTVQLAGIQVDKNKYPALQRNAAQVKGNQRILPKPIVVKVTVNNHPARALLDSGSLGDFMSSTLADQLQVKRITLDSPLALQLAVQGSRSKVNTRASVQLQYQNIDEARTFDVINLNNYDLILGTPWMHQHQVCIGFNPARVVIGSDESQQLKVGDDTKLMVHALAPGDLNVEDARKELQKYAEPLCKEISETDLPPLRAINHTIPLIDETKTYLGGHRNVWNLFGLSGLKKGTLTSSQDDGKLQQLEIPYRCSLFLNLAPTLLHCGQSWT